MIPKAEIAERIDELFGTYWKLNGGSPGGPMSQFLSSVARGEKASLENVIIGAQMIKTKRKVMTI